MKEEQKSIDVIKVKLMIEFFLLNLFKSIYEFKGSCLIVMDLD